MIVDNNRAIMSKQEFDQLGVRQWGLPTGKYEGKRWKTEVSRDVSPSHWIMVEFVFLSHNHLTTKIRDIVVLPCFKKGNGRGKPKTTIWGKTPGPQWDDNENMKLWDARGTTNVNTGCCGKDTEECQIRKNRGIVMRPG